MSHFISCCIQKAHVIAPGRDLGIADVRVEENGRIAAVGGADAAPRSGDRVLDAHGQTLIPGFVDIHSHGRGGYDFCDATDEAFNAIGRGKRAHPLGADRAVTQDRLWDQIMDNHNAPFA